jgi:hypothetical protein
VPSVWLFDEGRDAFDDHQIRRISSSCLLFFMKKNLINLIGFLFVDGGKINKYQAEKRG